MTNPPAQENPRRGTFAFRDSRPTRPRLAPDRAKRQGEIAQLAFLLLGGKDNAIAFLNEENAELMGRPIDIAMQDGEGFLRVQQAIRRIAAKSESHE